MKTNVSTDLWKRIDRGSPDECWEWQGARNKAGYGVFSLEGRDVSTHRLAFELATGTAPGALMVLHSCDNPPCCNPAHLSLGTAADNTRDAAGKGRLSGAHAGEGHHFAKLRNDDALAIYLRRRAGERGIDLAREFGVSQNMVCNISRGRDWRHVTAAAA